MKIAGADEMNASVERSHSRRSLPCVFRLFIFSPIGPMNFIGSISGKRRTPWSYATLRGCCSGFTFAVSPIVPIPIFGRTRCHSVSSAAPSASAISFPTASLSAASSAGDTTRSAPS